MNDLLQKLYTGTPFLIKEFRNIISEKTPFFFIKTKLCIYIFFDHACNGLCKTCLIGQRNARNNKSDSVKVISKEKFIEVLTRQLFRQLS